MNGFNMVHVLHTSPREDEGNPNSGKQTRRDVKYQRKNRVRRHSYESVT